MRGRDVLLLFCLGLLGTSAFDGTRVTYDHRALVIDGMRRLLFSGSIHYLRSTPDMWPDLIQKAKDGGLDVIQTYVFWNMHEPIRNQYDFEGRKDLVKFVSLVHEAGLFVHLRIGPYACAEWNYGGFPLWLHFIPGIKFRTDNEPFKAEMKRFTAKIVDIMKEANLYASQGGPIILSQIENEYGDIDSAYGAAGISYMKWAASMATSLDSGVPWVMCQQNDAPDPIINTCNGFYCDGFTPNSKDKPSMWTENWSGWFSAFGGANPYRPVEDIAFAVARFYQRGGTFSNYYMYHGGTNFGRTTGGPFITTSYDYDAPIDEYGLIRQPKWGHLKDVHEAIKLCEVVLLATEPVTTSLGPNLEATVYKTGPYLCAAFLANFDSQSDATVSFNGMSYNLPAWSVSILPNCKNVALNTAKINSGASIAEFVYHSVKDNVDASEVALSSWSWFSEPVGISSANAFSRNRLLEQKDTTADRSDYLWYSTSIKSKKQESLLHNGAQTTLQVDSLGHVLHVYVNGKLAGNGKGNYNNPKISIEVPITLAPGKNKVDLLSLTVGLQNYGAFFDLTETGVTGPVILKSSSNGSSIDLSSHQWTYQVGLKGEALDLPSAAGSSSSVWTSGSTLPKDQPLIWYKTSFDAPPSTSGGSEPVAIDFTGMGKGEAWVNGESIGRYWPTYTAPDEGCNLACNFRGRYSPSKCQKDCGKPSQRMYHVPRSWLKQSGNTLVLFEEMGGDPSEISFATRQIRSICSHVSEDHPDRLENWSWEKRDEEKSGAMSISLECAFPDQVISSIKFASLGNPEGSCGSFKHGSCHSGRALPMIEKACLGLRRCSVGVEDSLFGDPCVGVKKTLAVEAQCT